MHFTFVYYGLLVVTGGIVAKLADIEDRNPVAWGLSAVGAGWLLGTFMGMWRVGAPALVLFGAFGALWIAKLRDEDRGRRGRHIR